MLTPTQIVDIDCRHVWNEITNYMEGDLTPKLRERIAHHLEGCRHCSAVYDGTKNVVRLLGDDRALELPRGFSQRLYQRLQQRS